MSDMQGLLVLLVLLRLVETSSFDFRTGASLASSGGALAVMSRKFF